MDIEDLKVDFNAVLTSGGGSLTERQFLCDFKSLIGKNIPYRQLGHPDIRSLLQSLGGYYFTTRNGETVINSRGDEKTAHIASLIARQKTKPGKSKKRRSNFSSSYRPQRPAPLSVPVRRPAPPRSVVYSGTQRQPPPPRFGNPPIVPQRQPLNTQTTAPRQSQPSTAASRLSQTSTSASRPSQPSTTAARQYQPSTSSSQTRAPNSTHSSPQSRLERGSSINIPTAQNQILNDNLDNSSRLDGNSNTKVPALVEEAADKATTYIDIQWLQSVVKSREPTRVTNSAANMPQPPDVPVVDRPRTRNTTLPDQTVVFKCYVDELSSMASRLGLGEPVFTEIRRKPSRGSPVYMAKIKLGSDIMFSSYPEEKPTPEEAKEQVAKLACDDLRKRLGKLNIREPKLLESELVDRIYKIVQNKTNGIFDQAVVECYEEQYKTMLPGSWLAIIKESPKFSIENYADSRSIIYPAVEGNGVYSAEFTKVSPLVSSNVAGPAISNGLHSPVPSEVLSPASGVTLHSAVSTKVPGPAITNGHHSPVPTKVFDPVKTSIVGPETLVRQSPTPVLPVGPIKSMKDFNANDLDPMEKSEPRKLPGLDLPSAATWDVYVTSVGTNDISLRLIGDEYDAKYNDVMTDLEMWSVTHNEEVPHPQVNEYYSIKCDSCCVRVKLKEIISDVEGEVYFPDNGETDTILLSELRVLPNEYLTLPAQALQCKLTSVDISNEAAQTYLINHVVGSSFVAEVIKVPTAVNSIAHLILHKTDSVTEPLNINHLILDEIIKKIDPPQLTQRHLSVLRLTCVEPETSPYCQVQGEPLKLLEKILQEIYDNMDLVEMLGVSAHPRINSPLHQKQFLCKYMHSWRRGTIVNMDDPRNPLVFYVDYGQKENVKLCDIFDLEKVLPPLNKFPAQAIQVNLLDLPPSKLNAGVIHRLLDLAPSNNQIIGKFICNEGGLPVIELFKRVQPSNMIASINTDLIFNYDEYSKNSSSASSSPQKAVSPGCTDPLEKYPLPSANSGFFDVSISMSSNPYNFVVQPIDNREAFDAMMLELNELYEAQSGVMPCPAIEELTENSTFAAKHPEDMMWYRVSIVAAVSDSLVSVRYADWGDAGVVALDRLRYLEPRFRSIPALAIRARLHGVKPKEGDDWSVSTCIYFNELIDSKSFVSIVKEVNPSITSNSWQLSLQLIDTSIPGKDVDIAGLLINSM